MMRLKDQGIEIYPLLEPQKIGLERVRVGFELSSDFANHVSLFEGLHQKAGLIFYSRPLFSDRFDTEFLVPKGSVRELRTLLRTLEKMKIMTNSIAQEILWKQIVMMKTAYYDYEEGEWDVDFSRLRGDPSVKLWTRKVESKFDHSDLLIIKMLQLNPWAKAVEMAKMLRVTPEDAAYHLNKHVIGLKQIPGFSTKWIGHRDAWAKHSIIPITFVFEKLSEISRMRVMPVISSIPFTWNHMLLKDGTYMTELLIPVTHLVETMKYLSDNLGHERLMPLANYLDPAYTSGFTIPYMMHDIEKGWTFNAEESLAYIVEMIRSYK
jgi:hypothetical protein